MFVALFGGPPPKGDAAWSGSDDEGAGICLQACNAPMVRMLQAAAFASQGAMQYKCIQSLNTLGCVSGWAASVLCSGWCWVWMGFGSSNDGSAAR